MTRRIVVALFNAQKPENESLLTQHIRKQANTYILSANRYGDAREDSVVIFLLIRLCYQ